MKDLGDYLKEFICEGTALPVRGRPRIHAERVTTNVERAKKSKEKKRSKRIEHIAILDTETDPFDRVTQKQVRPFLAVLYSDNFDPIIIWENDFKKFIKKLVAEIRSLPDEYTIYAHNGGRFDFMFLISEMRGQISFKGRGIMSAKIGNHHLRDSFHLIPEKLAAYQKDVFDYSKLLRNRRHAHKDEIIHYCINDCKYLLDLVRKFVCDFGLKLSIGQAAMCELKKVYEVEKFSDNWDKYVREYFFGGRVECIQGKGIFTGGFKLIDVNSMYPYVMSAYQHPIGGMNDYTIRKGPPSNDTIFIELTCRNNGALVGRTESGETSARIAYGRFKTTIWEYETALKYGLISDIKIHYSLDCPKRTNFSNFILPLYENRQRLKAQMNIMKKAGQTNSAEFIELKKDDMFYKFLLNNSYGKFAQNPRRFKEHYITDPDEMPPDSWFKSIQSLNINERDKYMLPHFEAPQYWIWTKPAPSFSFNNVGTAASITGASRAVLLEALQHVKSPIYCDTDSIICREIDKTLKLHKTELGAWDLEDEFSRVVIAGKKLYAPEYKSPKPRTAQELERGMSPNYIVKSKGTSEITWDEMIALVNGETIEKTNRGSTLTRYGEQYYLTRKIRATAETLNHKEI